MMGMERREGDWLSIWLDFKRSFADEMHEKLLGFVLGDVKRAGLCVCECPVLVHVGVFIERWRACFLPLLGS